MGLGLMEAGWAAGALVGIVLAGNVRLEHQGRMVVGAVAAAGLMMVAVGTLGAMPGVVAALAVMGVAIGYVNIVAVSWLQGRVQPAMVGRVMSIVMLMSFGITPLSLGLSGALLDLNATALFVGAGVLTVLAALFAVAVRLPAMLDERPAAARSQPGPPRERRTTRRPDPQPEAAVGDLPSAPGSVTVNRAPPAGRGVGADRPAVRVHDPARDRQPKTRAAGAVARGAGQAGERLEDRSRSAGGIPGPGRPRRSPRRRRRAAPGR